MNLDTAKEAFENIKSEFFECAGGAVTEEDTRFRLINRMITEVLGWEFKEVQTEQPNDSGFSDYLLKSNDRTRAVVEVKRTSRRLTNSKSKRLSFLKVGGSGLDEARKGIEQASNYCFQEGVDLSVLTNGTTWIVFRASRNDGKRPADGKAAVFNSLDIVSESFQVFYELLGREHLVNRVYRAILDEQEGFKLLPKEPLFSPYDITSGIAVYKSEHARDLEEVFDSFFSTISGDNDKSLLLKCFVESKESQHAEKVLARITSEVLEQIEPMQSSTGGQLATEIRRAAMAKRGEKVLLIGNKGSGKSTFIDRFFEISLDHKMRRHCVVLKLDLKKYEAGVGGISEWLDRQLQNQIDKKLYGDEPPTYDELQGVFHSVYQKWAVGPHKHLHDSDLTAFKIKFGDYLQEIADRRPHEYCTSQLENVVKSRKLLPCIIFDNTDQFSNDVQQAVFQYANAIYERVGVCFLIVPITDHTVWQLSKSGPLQSYEAKSFFLPVPSTREVLGKRIRFLSEEVEKASPIKGSYSLPNGIQVALDDLRAFAQSLEEVFLNNEFVARRVGYLSNFDIRRSLQLSKRIMTSPHIGIDDLIKMHLTKGALRVESDNLSLAIVNGQNSYFRQDQSEFILNLFSIDPALINSPLLRLRILVMLLDKQRNAHDPLESFLTYGDIEQYFDVMGVSGQVIRGNLQALLDARLIEPYNPTIGKVIEGQSVSITTSGEMHVELAFHDNVYFVQMGLTTAIREKALANMLKKIDKDDRSRLQKDQDIRERFLRYCVTEDSVFIKVPESNENYRNQRSLVDELQARQQRKGERGVVKWFNAKAGYGFVTLNSTGADAFLSLTVLEQFGLGYLASGQTITCSISESSRGSQVVEISQVDDIDVSGRDGPQAPKLTRAKVLFYNRTKGYGFLRPEGGGRDILLPRRTLNSVGLSEIDEGEIILVETEMQIRGPVATALAIGE